MCVLFVTFLQFLLSVPEFLRRFLPISSVCLDIKNKRRSVLYSYYKIIEQEINKMAIHTHVIFRPRNAMFSSSNTYVFLSLLSFMVNSILVNRARFC